MRRHVERCWLCRGRQHDLQQRMAGLVEELDSFRDAPFLSAEQARLRFLRSIRNIQHEPVVRRPWHSTVALSISMLAALAIVLQPKLNVLAGRRVSDRWERAKRSEAKVLASPILRQTVAVELESRAGEKAENGQIELLCDRRSDRLVIKWRSSEGALLFALWRSGPGREFAYNALESSGVRPSKTGDSSITHSDLWSQEVSTQSVTHAIASWLEWRDRKPISLARENPYFARLSPPADEAPGSISLEWRESTPTVHGKLTLDLEHGSLRPTGQVLDLITSSDTVQIRFALVRAEPVDHASIANREFDPNPLLVLARGLPANRPSVLVPAVWPPNKAAR